MARGFHQVYGFNFKKKFSHTIKLVTIKIIIYNAYLNGHLQKELYMVQLQDLRIQSIQIECANLKAIYSLKISLKSLAWDSKPCLICYMGFERSKVDFSLLWIFLSSTPIFLLIYIDDIIITRGDEYAITSLIKHLNDTFFLKYMGLLNYFLGLEVTSLNHNELLLSQTNNIK